MSIAVPQRSAALAQSRGVGMIEVLAALFILSVGLLGIAGLQAQGIRAGHTSMLRSLAVFKSAEIMEAMRANQTGVLAGNYNAVVGADNGCYQSAAVNFCTPAQMASNDVFEWQSSLVALFPVGVVGTITTSNVPAPSPANPGAIAKQLVEVSIQWSERGDAMSYSVQTQIP